MVIVWNINKTVYIYLSHIVKQGVINIYDRQKQQVLTRSFENSNYEKVDMKDGQGDFTVKVSFDKQSVTKQINL